MKKLFLAFITGLMFFTAVSQSTQTSQRELRHMVLFTFKETSTKEEVANVVKSFTGLYGKVPQVKKMEWGLNISPEHLDQGFTHCFLLTFSSEKDLADYQLNPAHKQFQAILKPHMDKVFVVDYWAQQAQ
jgi:hypothetical protein